MKLKGIFALLLIFLIAISLTACSSDNERSQPIETDWSRGLVVGTANLREPATVTLGDRGQDVHLVWAQKGEYGIDVHYALVDREDGVQVSEQLQTGLFLPRSFRSFVTIDGQAYALTHAKSNKDGVSGVYQLRISKNGELTGRPELVTPPEQSVESYDAIMLPDGQLTLVWELTRDAGGGLFHRVLDTTSEDSVGQANLAAKLNATGQGPSMVLDQTNTLHLIWYVDDGDRGLRDVYYIEFANAEIDAGEGDVVTSIPLNDSANLSQPVIGIDDGHTYVFWHSDIVGGLRAGTGTTDFIAFPTGRPQQTVSNEVLIPDIISETASTPQNQLSYSLISPEMVYSISPYIIYPSPISSNALELPLLLSAKMTYRLQAEMQPMMAVFVDGVQVGYSPLARTKNATFFPSGSRDVNGEAYAGWIDYGGGGRYPIYLSSTSSEWKAGALQTTAGDITTDVFRELGFGLLTVVTLIPMTLLVFLLSLSWIIVLLLLGRAQNLDTRSGRIQFGVAIVIFYLIKTVAFAPLLSSPSVLQSMSQLWAGIMIIVLPALIFALAAIPTVIYIRRGDPPGLPTSFFLFAIIDLFFTVLIYGPSLYT